MKKLLAIIVLGLISGCATMEGPISSGMSKYDYCLSKNMGAMKAMCNARYYYYQNGVEVLKKGNTYAVFKNVSEPTTSTTWTNRFGNGTFVAEVYGWSEAEKMIASLDSSKKIVTNNNSNSSSSNNKIAEAKKACKELGFKPKSEKFSDCALKLVTLDFERTTTAKNEPQVVIHKNVSNTNIFDELDTLFRKQGIIQSTTRPSSSRNSFNCTSSRTVFGQIVTNCR
tara:strand:- start:713 stop:1390 length:678 start_codon:yes stop_codon:yes gene_type:complete